MDKNTRRRVQLARDYYAIADRRIAGTREQLSLLGSQ